jgi:hypothetical protein
MVTAAPHCSRRKLRHLLAPLTLYVCACSAQNGGPQNYGTVIVNVSVPSGIKTSGGTYLVASSHGEPVRFGTLTADLAPIQLVLPQAADYVLSVNTLGHKSNKPVDMECEGFRKFDVFRKETHELPLPLVCSPLWPPAPEPEPPVPPVECGIDALVVGPLRQLVGAEVNASVSATPAESDFEWMASDSDIGHYTHPDSDNVSQTSFVCDEAGQATLTLVVSSEGCSDEASVQITCVDWPVLDAGRP